MTPIDETRLSADLRRIIAGRPVSLVGNAASLLASGHGSRIDAGCVVRLNSGIPVRPAAQGRRIDVHCFSTRPSLERNLRLAPWRIRFKRGYLRGAYSVWMSEADRSEAADPDQAFYPRHLREDLAAALGARPSVGVATFHMLSTLTDAGIRIFGFDFKASGTYYRTKDNKGAHDWAAERDFVLEAVERNGWQIFS
ncbi:hypothetical protein [Jannaschia rubra]|uniref:Glycosyltransferase family 29 (Sialyltransferase) n=1 Tax=Jannaschia rubra TaxID=282197 RepID=A0A0M6XJA9_9RHOB|nr:hypothetical protein [Jannaschia rubra]CTQ31280.1 hypothetical protein JAN5088_00034 [Jannaschia rubra]SFF90471.1 hypothetical protein SAMN04488517_101775 [Jannaschia rubra]